MTLPLLVSRADVRGSISCFVWFLCLISLGTTAVRRQALIWSCDAFLACLANKEAMLSAPRRFVVSFAGSIKADAVYVLSVLIKSRARTSHRILFSARGRPCMRLGVASIRVFRAVIALGREIWLEGRIWDVGSSAAARCGHKDMALSQRWQWFFFPRQQARHYRLLPRTRQRTS